MTILETVQIKRLEDNKYIEAVIKRFSSRHLKQIEAMWLPRLTSARSWASVFSMYSKFPTYETYVLEVDDIVHGLLAVETQIHRSWVYQNERVLYVEHLVNSPWARNSAPDQKYKYVGAALLGFAHLRSVELGYRGLLGLHSLPEAEEFYRKMEFQEFEQDPEADGLVYFEFIKNSRSI